MSEDSVDSIVEEPVVEESPTTPPDTDCYQSLEPSRINQTIDLLQERIKERFPDRGLNRVCQRLQEIGARSEKTTQWVSQPILWLRVCIGLLLLLIASALIATIFSIDPATQKALTFVELLAALESTINDIILVSAGVLFLVTIEIRIKRKRALDAVHELRSLVHIIDMHQLTKDPERLSSQHKDTESSPSAQMTPFELNRYLDYCSEMLSLCAKLAALYAQNFSDSVVLAAVGEVEQLSIGLSGNIWQKIAILQSQSP